MKRLAIALLLVVLSGCTLIRSVVWSELLRPCGSRPGPCHEKVKKCTAVTLCGPTADGKGWTCQKSDTLAVWPPICKEDKKKK